MLYLHPPFHVLEGVTLLPDHADPLQWYYLPLAPHLVTVDDPVVGGALPMIQLIKFRGDAGDGGVLSFDVHLGLDEERREEILAQIRGLADLDGQPRLAPAPLIDGSVKLLILGKDSSAPEPDPDDPAPDPGIFDVRISHASKPSLFGDNRAVFSVELDREAVTVMEAALAGDMVPAAVVYSLEYLALRPAYSVRVTADWNRVQTHFEESEGFDSLVFSSQIDTVVDELIDERVIQIEADAFIADDGDGSAVLDRMDQAVNEVREMVTEAFFEPSLDPMNPTEPDGWDRFADTTERLAVLGATGGWSAAIPTFKYRKIDLTRIDRKVLNVSFNERTTVRRSIHPQAHLSGLFKTVRDLDVGMDRFVLPVDLDTAWFERRTLRVVPRADFAGDRIASIKVDLDYGGDIESLLFDPNNTGEQSVDWLSIVEDTPEGERVRREVEATFEVLFADVDGSERPRRLRSEPRTVTAEVLEIVPRDLYELQPVPIVALSYPWERYSHVEVALRHEDAANGIRQEDSFLLDQNAAEATWNAFLLDLEADPGIEVRLIHRAVDHGDVEGGWKPLEGDRVVVRDPFPSKRVLEVVPAVSWDSVERVFVDLEYEDEANGVRETASLQFSGDDRAPKAFVVDLVDPEHRLVGFRATVLKKDGSMVRTPASVTREPRVFVTEAMRGHRVVTVRPADGVLANGSVRSVEVELRFVDAANGLEFSDRFRFTDAADLDHFEYDYVDEATSDYEFRITWHMANGLARTRDWTAGDRDELVVEAS